jgi:hypothetical protein
LIATLIITLPEHNTSSIENSDSNKNSLKDALLHCNEYDTLSSKEPTEANVYAGPHQYLKWLHATQEKLNKKQLIQGNVSQNSATPDYDYRKIKKNLDCERFRFVNTIRIM